MKAIEKQIKRLSTKIKKSASEIKKMMTMLKTLQKNKINGKPLRHKRKKRKEIQKKFKSIPLR